MSKNFKPNTYENLVKHHLRFDTLEDLLSELPFLENIKIEDNTLKVIFHEDFVFTTKIKLGFSTFINDVYYYTFDDPDICELLKEISDDLYIIIQYQDKHGFFERNRFKFILKEQFYLKKVKHIKDVYKIFDIKGIIYSPDSVV